MDPEQNNQQVGDQQQQQQIQQQPQQQPAISFTPEQLTTAMKEAFASSQPQPQAKEPTPEELRAAAKVWTPDKGFVQNLRKVIQHAGEQDLPDEELLAPFGSLRDGLMTQAQTHAENLTRAALEHITKTFGPVLQEVQRQNVERATKQFYKAYPSLKGNEEIVQAVAAQLAQSGTQVKDAAEAHRILAEKVASVVKKFNPGFELDTPNSPKQAGGTAPLTTLQSGGQGGQGSGAKSGGTSQPNIWS